MINFKEEFLKVETIEEAKAIYKKFAKQFHPDMGGDTEIFKILNSEYHKFIDNFSVNHILDDDFEGMHVELEKIIIDILHFENIVIEIIGSWVWVSGDTRAVKDILKSLGFKWASKKKMWFFGQLKKSCGRGNMDINVIKAKYGSKTVKNKFNKKIGV